MAKWEQLIAAREQRHLSQAEAAERLNVGLVTYQRWEQGKRKPQPQHMRRLCETFSLLEDESIPCPAQTLSPGSKADSFPPPLIGNLVVVEPTPVFLEEDRELHSLVATNMTARLWSLAFLDHPNNQEKRDAIRQAIKDFDAMNADNKNYQITRREALCLLAGLPMITLDLATPGRVLQSAQYGTVVAHCAASLEACWELSKSSDAKDVAFAFQSSLAYMHVLEAIARHSSRYRQEALDLTARYALLRAFHSLCERCNRSQ